MLVKANVPEASGRVNVLFAVNEPRPIWAVLVTEAISEVIINVFVFAYPIG